MEYTYIFNNLSVLFKFNTQFRSEDYNIWRLYFICKKLESSKKEKIKL